ncbi:hypothetical protein TNCT_941 [Trichonephila clavata]|uniref:Uncharacterized protein n=1 Tax=Trichonephila clavata TaxID=2740835 RepID=A0A8X6IE94_TRICU|nr:hypothetical protein TNCT_941 [Trichonephila clavata]
MTTFTKSTGDMMTFILRSSSVDSLFQPTLSIFDLRPNGIKSFLFAPSVAFDMPPPSIPFIIYGILQQDLMSYSLMVLDFLRGQCQGLSPALLNFESLYRHISDNSALQ